MFTRSLLAATILSAFSGAALANNVTGQVMDDKGNPVAGAEVSVEGSRKTVLTDEQGRYTLYNVPVEDVHIHVSSQNYLHGDKDLGPISGNPEVNFTLLPASVENIVVTASAMQTSVLESVTPVTVLNKDELSRKQAPTLGATLNNTPGVHSTYFGPVSSSPVIRGNDGPRVKIVQNGLDVSDVSRIGPDHNVATSTSSATQVEILRGPATLQYGSGAIGGVVNVVDRRIPSRKPVGLEGEAEVRYSTVDNGRYGKVDVTGASGDIAYHADGFKRNTDNVDIPGYASVNPDGDEPRGVLENSQMDTTNFTGGLSYIQDEGFIGFAVEKLDNQYGVPGHHHHEAHDDEHDDHAGDHEEEHADHDEMDEHTDSDEAGTRIDVDMTRYQVAGEWHSPIRILNNIKFGVAHTDYEHVELEGGMTGTRFTNESTNLRVTADHIKVDGWHGVVGVQGSTSDYSAVGAEAFTPPTETDTLALFLVEQKRFGNLTVEAGARVEKTQYSAADTQLDLNTGHAEETHHDEHEADHEEHAEEHNEVAMQSFSFDDYDFTSTSFSAGFNWEYEDGYAVAFTASRNERAPSLQELFAGGQHLATQTYEVGLVYDLEEDGDIANQLQPVAEEVSNNLDLTFRKYTGEWGYTVSFFYNQADDYIYQSATGLVAGAGHAEHEEEHGPADEHGDDHDAGHEEDSEGHEEGLPVFSFRQADADIYGMEAQMYVNLDTQWRLEVFGDMIRAKLDNQDLPRIPPLRVGSTLSYEHQQLRADVGFTFNDEQDQVAPFETVTDSYTMVNASVEYEILGNGTDWVFFANADNLFDEEARVHTSFLKDQAPLPGRNLTVGVRASF
ncbi:TonB-dependent receptor [Salinimonas chungwhensis]|uniref:TonB-dependent receptor n=1 Tax=Salinimonas chungwhensis TaxID=265425 RepID=UPI00037B05A6|nr:TonB-dependent receptor [Salinimonas chungwhensis]